MSGYVSAFCFGVPVGVLFGWLIHKSCREVDRRVARLIDGADRGIGMTLLHRIIVGSFKSAADAHGAGPPWAGSAAKRIATAIMAELTDPDGG